MLVNAADMLKKAEAGKYALGAFNTNNLEWTLAILQAAEEAKSPLILQCTAGAAKWMGGFKVCADMVKAAVEATGVTVPVALHLDHGSYEDCFKCIEAGFTSIMYDGSHEETFQLNLDRTKELVELAHSKGMSIEAEVGGIGGTEDGVTSNGELADPAECKQIADLGVDFLACGIGNIHGVYPADWAGLSFERLGEIKAQTGDLPLVLHGGTGIPEDQIMDLATNECNTTPCMMPYVTTFFMPRAEGDRPKVVPDGSVNLAFVGQFADTPRDTVFTTEYSIRTGMEAVYTLCNVDRGVPEVWGSVYDVRDLLYATSKLLDGKKPAEFLLPSIMPLLGLLKEPLTNNVVVDLLKKYGIV